MRILQISSAKSFGGGEKYLVDLSKGLIQKGHEVFLAVRPKCEWKDKLAFLPKSGIFQVPLRNSLDVFSARKIAKIIRENDIEIVHAHLARDYVIAGLATRFAPPAKFVLTRHVLFPMSAAHKFALNNLSKAIAVSGAVEKQLEKTISPEKIVKIYNGIDAAHFKDANPEKLRQEFRFENNIPYDAPFIGTIGELKPLKGQLDFVLAAQLVAQKYPEARFAVVGKDNSLKRDFRRELKRMVRIFNLEDRFLWLDWIDDTKTILHALDVFVSPSHSESFGLAILEAMACGTPIVSTETAGAAELLNGDSLVPIENPKRLADEIRFFLKPENEDKKTAFSKNNQLRAGRFFSLEKMISETEDVYLQILKEAGKN